MKNLTLLLFLFILSCEKDTIEPICPKTIGIVKFFAGYDISGDSLNFSTPGFEQCGKYFRTVYTNTNVTKNGAIVSVDTIFTTDITDRTLSFKKQD